ncbi:MAG: 3,4-dihydroxy-2-butanone-4-phosphate synthase [Planctomycetota bacterium]
MDSIADILKDLRAGKVIVLLDDEGREDEGDLVCASEFATPEVVNFMLREGRGMLFVSLTGEACDRLQLPPQHSVNTTQRGTAYTLTVDATARLGVTTGVSAQDRSTTIQKLADPDASPLDFDRPGHVQPLRARDGGTLVRAGHTEGLIDLMRLAGLHPCAVGIEVMNDDGTMARRPQIDQLAKKFSLKVTTVADVIQHRLERDRLIERMDVVPFTNELGDWRLVAYRSAVDPFPHVALVCGDGLARWDDFGEPIDTTDPVLVRMHSQNLLGDVFGDATQPSGQTLRDAMRMIQRQGSGAVIYLRHEGMGKGLLKRLQTGAPPEGADPNDERIKLGSQHETPGTAPATNKADYGIGCQILRDLGIRRLRLITAHPFTPTALSGYGLEIDGFIKPTP